MAKYCGKCGSRLDEVTGLCPSCDAAKIKQQSENLKVSEASAQEQGHQAESKGLSGKKNISPSHRTNKRGQKKAAKREKQASWSTGKKVRRFFMKLILTLLLLVVLAVGAMGALEYLGITSTPFLSSVIDSIKEKIPNMSITPDNNDYTFTPTEEYIAFDTNSNILYFNNQLIVYTFSELNERNADKLAELVDGKVVGHISGSINALQIQVKTSTLEELNSMAAQLMEHTDVLYAGYDYPMQLFPTEADSNPWSTDHNSPEADRGNESNPQGNDWWAEAIGAYTAWNYSDKCQAIKVGIIDSGFDTDHEDLNGRITFLPKYSTNSETNHGTNVAGIIGANNNTIGIRGIADSAELICVDWTPVDSVDYLSTGEYIEIIKELIENNVKIINNSWGNTFFSKGRYAQEEYGDSGDLTFLLQYFFTIPDEYDRYVEASKTAFKRTAFECVVIMIELLLNGHDDFLIIQGAGNGENNGGPGIDAYYSAYFCAINAEIYNLLSESTREILLQKNIDYKAIDERILIVGAVENNQNEKGYRMTQYSNFGPNVDICAPGGSDDDTPETGIFCTMSDNKYGVSNGTSMAAPMVAGSAAFIWSLNPELSAPEVKDILLKNTTTQAYGVGGGVAYTYPMLNVGAAAEAVVSDMEETKSDSDTLSISQSEPTSAFDKYLAAVEKTTESGSWSEQLALEADISMTYNGGKTKTKMTLNADSDVSNYIKDNLSQIEISGLAEMKIMGQTYAWSTEYKDGVAHYEYTEPFQKSQSLEIDPTFFDFETITSEAILEEEASGNEIHFIVSGKKISETDISAIQQISGIENLNCGDVEVTVTLSDSGCIHQLLMNFDASVKYQGYDADVAYKVQYNFS